MCPGRCPALPSTASITVQMRQGQHPVLSNLNVSLPCPALALQNWDLMQPGSTLDACALLFEMRTAPGGMLAGKPGK